MLWGSIALSPILWAMSMLSTNSGPNLPLVTCSQFEYILNMNSFIAVDYLIFVLRITTALMPLI